MRDFDPQTVRNLTRMINNTGTEMTPTECQESMSIIVDYVRYGFNRIGLCTPSSDNKLYALIAGIHCLGLMEKQEKKSDNPYDCDNEDFMGLDDPE